MTDHTPPQGTLCVPRKLLTLPPTRDTYRLTRLVLYFCKHWPPPSEEGYLHFEDFWRGVRILGHREPLDQGAGLNQVDLIIALDYGVQIGFFEAGIPSAENRKPMWRLRPEVWQP